MPIPVGATYGTPIGAVIPAGAAIRLDITDLSGTAVPIPIEHPPVVTLTWDCGCSMTGYATDIAEDFGNRCPDHPTATLVGTEVHDAEV